MRTRTCLRRCSAPHTPRGLDRRTGLSRSKLVNSDALGASKGCISTGNGANVYRAAGREG